MMMKSEIHKIAHKESEPCTTECYGIQGKKPDQIIMDEEDDDSQMWKEHKKAGQEKRWKNEKQSLDILRKNGIYFEVMSESSAHYRVGDFDFWPTTGKFINRKTKESSRGVFNLIKDIGNRDTRFCEKHNDLSCFVEVIDCNDCSFFLRD